MSKETRESVRKTRRSTSKKGPKKHWFKRIFLTLIGLFVAVVLVGIGIFAYYASSSPKIVESQLDSSPSTAFYDAKGNEFKTLGLEQRTKASENDVPQTLKDAVVSIEDRRFYKHPGVDPIRIAGAALANFTGSSLGLQGGSTLTQQLVKLSVFSTASSDRTLKRKAQEAWLSLKIERQYSKEQILNYYINKVYLANGVYGMGTAAQFYYGKSLKELNLSQLALLAGMPQSPSAYDPYVHPEAATNRRNLVIASMYANKKITKQQAVDAQKVDISEGLVSQNNVAISESTKIIDAYLKQVLDEISEKTDYDVYKDGLKVYTNLDMDAQTKLYQIVNTNDYVNFPDDKMQAAVTMVDPTTGKVRAMIGGRKQGDVQLGLNRAVQTTRSNGSTMKPLADYGPAIEYLNYSTGEIVEDTPYKYDGTNISLYNFDKTYDGDITMRYALEQSRNIPAVRTLMNVGLDKSSTFLKGLGINLKNMVPSNGIGAEISTLQSASAFAAFSNGGTYYEPSYVNSIVTQDGTKTTYDSKGTRAMKKSTAYMITDMLKGVITKGTGTSAQIYDLIQAGKTGTTNYSDEELAQTGFPASGSPDVWFAGYTTNASISVWVGYDKKLEPDSYISAANSQMASKIYRVFMQYVAKNSTNTDWKMPNDVVRVGGQLYVKGQEPKTTTQKQSSSSSEESSSAVSSSESVESSASSSSVVESESSSTPTTPGTGGESSSESSATSSSEASSSSSPSAP